MGSWDRAVRKTGECRRAQLQRPHEFTANIHPRKIRSYSESEILWTGLRINKTWLLGLVKIESIESCRKKKKSFERQELFTSDDNIERHQENWGFPVEVLQRRTKCWEAVEASLYRGSIWGSNPGCEGSLTGKSWKVILALLIFLKLQEILTYLSNKK